jgi:uncharacterized protein DUF6614
MQHYHLWVDLKDSHRDLEFAAAVRAWLGHLQKEQRIGGFTLARRKLGFGPEGLGEFHVAIETDDLAQLDRAFDLAAARDGESERLHRAVYSLVTNFKAALYRDFPDPGRKGA